MIPFLNEILYELSIIAKFTWAKNLELGSIIIYKVFSMTIIIILLNTTYLHYI